jgi:hypothetical protein
MKTFLIVVDGSPVPVLPTLDRLAASGRVGLVDLGRKTDSRSALSLLTGADERGAACSSAISAGLRPSAGDVCLACRVALIGGEGNVSGFAAAPAAGEAAEMLDGCSIGGIRVSARASGSSVVLVLSGEGVSHDIAPNACAPGAPLPQVCAARSSPAAKKTASSLNKLIYRLKKETGMALVVESAGPFRELPQPFPDVESLIVTEGNAGRVLEGIDPSVITIIMLSGSSPAPAIITGGGILPGAARAFSPAACSRGFRVGAEELLPWVLRATK